MKVNILVLIFISLTSLYSRDWKEIKESGYINIGVRDAAQMVYRPNDKESPGLMYEMVRSFAKKNDLEIRLKVMPSFSSYWKKDGKILTKTNLKSTPDIYKEIDIAAEIFTVTKKREELVRMIPYINSVELLFARQNEKIKSYKNLIGKSLITYETMSFFALIKKELDKRDIPYNTTYITHKNGKINIPSSFTKREDLVNFLIFPKNTKVDGTLSYHPVANGYVDVGVNDAIAVMLRLFDNSHYYKNIRPLFPIQNKKSSLAWAVEKDNVVLAKKIEEFFTEHKNSGDFSKQISKYIGMSLDEYNFLINNIK